jgi:uncharacterized protein
VRNEPVAFAGERMIEATLAGGSTLDFNVMTRRACARHTVEHRLFSAPTTVASSVNGRIVLFALESGLTVDSERLDTYDTAIISSAQVAIAATAGKVPALVITIVDIRPNVL